jgi:hypothetical protein
VPGLFIWHPVRYITGGARMGASGWLGRGTDRPGSHARCLPSAGLFYCTATNRKLCFGVLPSRDPPAHRGGALFPPCSALPGIAIELCAARDGRCAIPKWSRVMIWLIIAPPEVGNGSEDEENIVGSVAASDIHEARQRIEWLCPGRTFTFRKADEQQPNTPKTGNQ